MKRFLLIFFILPPLLFLACKDEKQKIVVIFKNVNGLKQGVDVKEKGVPAGSVYKMDLHDSGIAVTLSFPDGSKIPINSLFVLQNEILGTCYIEIFRSKDSAYLKRGDTVYGIDNDKGSPVFSTDDSLTREKRKKALEKIGEGIKELFELNKDSSKSQRD